MKFSDRELLELAQNDGGRFGVSDEREAFDFCRRLALGHYENFPVGSMLIPFELRPHFYSVYAFSRIADDIGDELIHLGSETQLNALTQFGQMLESTSSGSNPIFIALNKTRQDFGMPASPFLRLLEAFKRDALFQQPDAFSDLLEYCNFSANPVGELVLYLAKIHNPTTVELSDKICTALQLANFWQDISRDIHKNRIYLPRNIFGKMAFDEDYLQSAEFNRIFLQSFPQLIAETDAMFIQGRKLLHYFSEKRLRLEIAATIEGGRQILRKTQKLGLNILQKRPSLNVADGVFIAFHVLKKIFRNHA